MPLSRVFIQKRKESCFVRGHEICFFKSARRFRASRGFSWSRSAARSFSRTARSNGVDRTSCVPVGWAGSVAAGGSGLLCLGVGFLLGFCEFPARPHSPRGRRRDRATCFAEAF